MTCTGHVHIWKPFSIGWPSRGHAPVAAKKRCFVMTEIQYFDVVPAVASGTIGYFLAQQELKCLPHPWHRESWWDGQLPGRWVWQTMPWDEYDHESGQDGGGYWTNEQWRGWREWRA